jgi:hypothetical protein
MSTTNETKPQAAKLEEEMRSTAEAAKAAGGKLARLGGEGRSKLLRALAAALREPGGGAAVAPPPPQAMAPAQAEELATPQV